MYIRESSSVVHSHCRCTGICRTRMKEEASSSRKLPFWKRPRFKLFCYFGSASWIEQLWMFSAGMAFGELGGNLQLTASAAFVASASILLFSPTLGKYIDQSNRLKAALATVFCTKISIILTMAALAAVLHFGSFISNIGKGELFTTLSVFCILTNMVATLATIASQVIIQKDWIVVLCSGDENQLTEANTILLRVKLISFLISPYMAGQIMVWTSAGTDCLVIALFTLVSLAIECPLLYSIYRSVPALSKKKGITDDPLLDGVAPNAEVPADGGGPDETDKATQGVCNPIEKMVQDKFIKAWKIYSKQKVLLAGISLSLLYCTVLGFDSITDVYAFSQGLKANTVALVKGCGAISGFLGSFVYPRVTKRVGLLKTGMIALVLDISCLILPLISIGLPGSPFDFSALIGGNSSAIIKVDTKNLTGAEQLDGNAFGTDKTSIAVLLTGIVLSRIGLWMADLAINQLFQETVPEPVRGTVGSVQNALNYLMEMIKHVVVIFLPEPETYGFLIIGSWCSVFTACLCYSVFARREPLKGIVGDDKPQATTEIE